MSIIKLIQHAALGAALTTSLCTTAFAAINSPVPASAYITQSGLDWAWAYPLPAANGINLTYQSTQGWRLPTATELASAPAATAFLKAGGNVPFNGTDPVSGAEFQARNAAYTGPGACATPYFSDSYLHCDWFNGGGQPGASWAAPGATGAEDQLVVRGALVVTAPTPVPLWGPLGLLLASASIGLAGMFASRKRKNG